MSFEGWSEVEKKLKERAATEAKKLPRPASMKEEQDIDGKYQHLDEGQRASLTWMAKRLPQSGVVLADEVGTGKTRIACTVVQAVLDAGGRAAVVVPHGLMHQWQHEAFVLGMRSAKVFTSLGDFIQDAKAKPWADIAPAPEQSEWLLISHGFRAPQVRQGQRPAEWRAALPSYVRAELSARSVRDDRRTYSGKLLDDPHETTQQIAKEVVSRVHGQERVKLRDRLDQLPPFRRGGDNSKLIEALKGDGRARVEELLGIWMGEFDLLVIDEAHKSRGEVDAEDTALGKVLARLVDMLLKQPANGRRLCLTATPMELELSQWLDLLDRAGSDLDPKTGERIIDDFQKATKDAASAPYEKQRLDALIEMAENFEDKLKWYVTRRRRTESEEIKAFRDKLVDEKQKKHPHPHRSVREISISWADTLEAESPWLDVLFAAECMSQSALGLNRKLFEAAIQLSGKSSDEKKQKRLKHLIRDMYARLASGHLSADIFDADVRIVPPDDCDAVARGKLQRTEYWRARIQKAMLNGLHEDEHPRILAAVKEIEGWTLKPEKVLVFGVFLRPLRLLRDVLNVRHALRAADARRPIAHAIHNDAALFGIALRQLDRLRAEGMLSARLATGNGDQVRDELAKRHKAYECLRDKVLRRAKKAVDEWCTDPSLLGGALVDRELVGDLEHHLVSFVLDDLLATTSGPDVVTDKRFDALTKEFVKERLRPLLGELSDEDNDEKQAKLRLKSIRDLLKDDNGRQSRHARLLDGGTAWQTRRYLQAAFNRLDASPWVLIAQSQVGREGLNLHESCRVVVQFHAEWNPAVLEQQIGRVDRKGSFWERLAQKWLEDGAQGEPPFVEIRQLIFEGTYDAFQWDRVMRRQHVFDASLFGSLLPGDAWERVPDEFRNKLLQAAPSFSPVKRAKG